jgi:hypothetical protein
MRCSLASASRWLAVGENDGLFVLVFVMITSGGRSKWRFNVHP